MNYHRRSGPCVNTRSFLPIHISGQLYRLQQPERNRNKLSSRPIRRRRNESFAGFTKLPRNDGRAYRNDGEKYPCPCPGERVGNLFEDLAPRRTDPTTSVNGRSHTDGSRTNHPDRLVSQALTELDNFNKPVGTVTPWHLWDETDVGTVQSPSTSVWTRQIKNS